MDNKTNLKQSINLHWLRPDNALWAYGFSRTFGAICREKTSNMSTLDLGCGDGTTSFLMLGGEFKIGFDAFHAIQVGEESLEPDTIRSSTGSLRDEKGDFYNVYDDKWKTNILNNILKRPPTKYTFGSDWKESLVKKANDLDLYNELSDLDSNIYPWIYDSNSIDFIFSTIIYWLNNPNDVLKEVNRVLSKDGIFAFSAPKTNITSHTLINQMKDFEYPNLSVYDRGRHANWERHSKDFKHWENLINENNFEIVDYKEFHPTLQIAFGETINRTLLSAYNILYKKLLKTDRDTFFEFKEEYCSKIYDLVEPFLDDEYYDNVEKAYHAFFIKKK